MSDIVNDLNDIDKNLDKLIAQKKSLKYSIKLEKEISRKLQAANQRLREALQINSAVKKDIENENKKLNKAIWILGSAEDILGLTEKEEEWVYGYRESIQTSEDDGFIRYPALLVEPLKDHRIDIEQVLRKEKDDKPQDNH